ncbi:R3H domain-containing protein [Desulfonema limicola]|uniref:RNA-binding protein KhpB n=1 Tax=Desulfonema limicola TaxID=45656 RepID=A0A975GED8_9BACT|nr:RNA-binding cell elongation regulator Jag/EloR [Desulfonema limicola]QTA78132.1 R3H domain-containing protein [Desulfonema limicola]
MSSCVEFEGKAVDNAVQEASDKLNIPREQLKYKVVSYGSSGIFGLVGVKKAKISVTLPKKPDKFKSPKTNNSDKNIETKPVEPVSEIDMETSESKLSPPLFEKEHTKDLVDKPIDKPAADQAGTSIVEEVFESSPNENIDENTDENTDKKDPETVPCVFPQDAIDNGREALQRIIDFITTDASITITKGEDRLLFNITGGNSGVLIGKRGQTLEAIQYLVEKIINKKSTERIRIQIDVEDYLDNRKANLESLAGRLAEKTRSTGKPSTIGQMNAHDRRIIHLSLKDDPGVRTQSIGDGFYRKLVIFPKRKNYRKKKK